MKTFEQNPQQPPTWSQLWNAILLRFYRTRLIKLMERKKKGERAIIRMEFNNEILRAKQMRLLSKLAKLDSNTKHVPIIASVKGINNGKRTG